MRKYHQKKRKSGKIGGKISAAATAVVTAPAEEVKEYVSPTLASSYFYFMFSIHEFSLQYARSIFKRFLEGKIHVLKLVR